MKKFLFLLSTILLISPVLTSCGHDDDNYEYLGTLYMDNDKIDITYANYNYKPRSVPATDGTTINVDVLCLDFGAIYNGWDIDIYMELEVDYLLNKTVNMIDEDLYLWEFEYRGNHPNIADFGAIESNISEISDGTFSVIDNGNNHYHVQVNVDDKLGHNIYANFNCEFFFDANAKYQHDKIIRTVAKARVKK